jgi:hypothetical protein
LRRAEVEALSLFDGGSGRLLFDGRPTSPISSLGRISFRRADIALAIEEPTRRGARFTQA